MAEYLTCIKPIASGAIGRIFDLYQTNQKENTLSKKNGKMRSSGPVLSFESVEFRYMKDENIKYILTNKKIESNLVELVYINQNDKAYKIVH